MTWDIDQDMPNLTGKVICINFLFNSQKLKDC